MTVLTDELARGRAAAVKELLARPLIDGARDPEAFALLRQHADWLRPWFETTCGWGFHLDIRDGVARLHKRSDRPDATRPAVRPRRSRSARRPFDRRRYQLLCLIAADLVRRPATTIGLLADELASVTGADPLLQRFEPAERITERRAFVDVCNLLAAWGVLRVTAGDLAEYVDDAQANAIVEVDQSRLHQLLATSMSPSQVIDEGDDPDPTTLPELLAREPRYGDAAKTDPDGEQLLDEEQRNRWRRHAVARRLLDDPVVLLEDLPASQRDYLTSQAGRQWLRDRIAEAGFVLEERAEGWAAIDPDAVATDRVFPGPGDNVKQAGLLLLDELVRTDDGGHRALVSRSRDELHTAMRRLLDRHAGWAKQARADDGPEQLCDDAIALLAELGLVRLDGATIVPLPFLARYTATPPRTSSPSLPGLGD
jgi:uncharacterized protein (TIGR02678 family)